MVLIVRGEAKVWESLYISDALLREGLLRKMYTYGFGNNVQATRVAARRGLRSITLKRPALYEERSLAIDIDGRVTGDVTMAVMDEGGCAKPFALLLADGNVAVFDFKTRDALDKPTVADYISLQERKTENEGRLSNAGVAGLIVGLLGAAVAVIGGLTLLYRRRQQVGLRKPHDFTQDLMALPMTARPFEAPQELSQRALHIDGRFDKGAFGSVHFGALRVARGTKRVAVKIAFVDDDSGAAPELRQRIFKEMVVLAQFRRQPYIVQLEGVITRGSPLIIVMELCENGSLEKVLREKLRQSRSETWQTKFRMAKEIARGMSVVHESNVLHLDLATRNILVTANGTCKVADFGKWIHGRVACRGEGGRRVGGRGP
jgi:serine/threonine protein kinase